MSSTRAIRLRRCKFLNHPIITVAFSTKVRKICAAKNGAARNPRQAKAPPAVPAGASTPRQSESTSVSCQEPSRLRAGSEISLPIRSSYISFSRLPPFCLYLALATPTLELRSKSISGREAFEGQKNTPCLPVRTCLFHEKHTFPSVWGQKRRFFSLSSLFLLNLQDKQGDKMC